MSICLKPNWLEYHGKQDFCGIAYLEAGIVTRQCEQDALHVALATVWDCAIVVSWNFKHIVHYQKVPMYNAVNVREGYRPIAIHSPLEVIESEE